MHDTIVTAPGSLGDVNPLLAIARGLQQAGRRVIFCAAERYLPLAERAGLRVHPLTSEERFGKMVNNPKLWHPRQGIRTVLRDAVADFIEPHYEWLLENCKPGETLLVSHLLDFSSRVFRDKFPETKFVSVMLAPVVLRSSQEAPRMTSHGFEKIVPRIFYPVCFWLGDRWIDSLAAPPINQLRTRIGLPPVKRILKKWWLAPDLVVALFPEWFSIHAQDVPAQLKHFGFPLSDSRDVVSSQDSQRLDELLGRFRDQPPVVFAPGTAHHFAGDFLEKARQACEDLQQPAILISTEPSQLPTNLPAYIATAQYAPFSQLFPVAKAVVHHGGIGTTSQCLSAGVPQVVMPMAFDQFDNAERVAKLKCGTWMPMAKVSRERIKAALQKLPQVATDCAKVQKLMQAAPNPLEAAVESIMKYVEQ